MAKEAVFLVVSHGSDGRGVERIEFASKSEDERNEWYNTHKNKSFFMTRDSVLDLENERKIAERNLDGLQKMLFGVENKPVARPFLKQRKNAA